MIDIRTGAFIEIFKPLSAERRLVTFGFVREEKMGILQLLSGRQAGNFTTQ